ncbi:MAG: hypothetical protein AAFQ15_02975 [Pseudomonadota bacterium]
MKMMKLLGAASAAALIAGAANAQLELNLDATTPAITLADEVDFAKLAAADEDTGTFRLEIIATGSVPDGQNYFLTIELGGGAVLGDDLTGTEFNLGASVGGGTVNAGGAEDDTSVRFLVRSDNSPNSLTTSDGFEVDIPIKFSSCNDVTVSVTELQTEAGGTPIDGGVASLTNATTGLADNVFECKSAFSAALVPDGTRTALNFAAMFADFVNNVDDSNDNAVLGDFSLTVDGTILTDVTTGTTASATQVTGFSADVNFVEDAGILNGQATGAGVWQTALTPAAANTIALAGTTDGVANDVGEFEINLNATTPAPVAAQNVSVSDALILFGPTTTLTASEPFVAADVENLAFNGSTFGPFDWVADTNGRVNSIFRVTGLGAITSDVPGLFILENSRNGNNGAYPFTVSPTDVQGNEVRFTSASIEAAAGAFSTADVTMVFGAALNLDVDRLLSGPSTATVVPFGDNANADDSGAGDTDSTDRQDPADDDDNGIFQ